MDRRTLLFAGGALAASSWAGFTPVRAAAAAMRTQWKLRVSEGYDALCFLGPLSGDEFYARFYGPALAGFLPKLKPETVATIKRLFAAAQAQGTLLGPELCLVFSGGRTETLRDLIDDIDNADIALR